MVTKRNAANSFLAEVSAVALVSAVRSQSRGGGVRVTGRRLSSLRICMDPSRVLPLAGWRWKRVLLIAAKTVKTTGHLRTGSNADKFTYVPLSLVSGARFDTLFVAHGFRVVSRGNVRGTYICPPALRGYGNGSCIFGPFRGAGAGHTP